MANHIVFYFPRAHPRPDHLPKKYNQSQNWSISIELLYKEEVFLKPRLSLSMFLRLVAVNSFNCLSIVKRVNINTNFSLLKNRTKCIHVFYFHVRGLCYQRTCNISREGLGQFHISKNILRVHLQSFGYKVHSTWSFPSKSDVSITVSIYENNCIMTPLAIT